MRMAAKYAKDAKTGGQGLEAFAFSAFFAANGREGMKIASLSESNGNQKELDP